MSSEMVNTSNNKYYYVIEDTFRTKSHQDDTEAIPRTNKKGVVVYERHTKALFGKIEGVRIYDQEFDGKKMKKLEVVLDAGEDGKNKVMSLTTDTRQGEDLLRRLPNMDMDTEYRFMPYIMPPEGQSKEKRGLSVRVKDEDEKFTIKVEDFFWDGTETKNGYPEATEEDKEDWAFFYKKANKFLVKYAEEKVIPKFGSRTEADPFEYPKDEIDPESIPF